MRWSTISYRSSWLLAAADSDTETDPIVRYSGEQFSIINPVDVYGPPRLVRDDFDEDWRAFLFASAEKRTGHIAIDTTGFDRDQPSRYYAR